MMGIGLFFFVCTLCLTAAAAIVFAVTATMLIHFAFVIFCIALHETVLRTALAMTVSIVILQHLNLFRDASIASNEIQLIRIDVGTVIAISVFAYIAIVVIDDRYGNFNKVVFTGISGRESHIDIFKKILGVTSITGINGIHSFIVERDATAKTTLCTDKCRRRFVF